MRVHILHHHLQTGGVTSVIESQVSALRAVSVPPDIRLITGSYDHPVKGLNKKEVVCNSVFGYLAANISRKQCREVYNTQKQVLKKYISPDDIIHSHNVGLGKNPVLTLVLYELAMEGYRIINHCHDFAEDCRTDNYLFLRRIITGYFRRPLGDVLYPPLKNYKFIVINSRDYNILYKLQLPCEQLNILMNPVVSVTDSNNKIKDKASICRILDIPENKPIFIYPVRAIRRKNLGEFLLFSLLFRNEGSWVVTQAPKNPREYETYMEWKKLAVQCKLPVVFEAGERVDFVSLIRASQKIWTTSIKEGFGMIFAEPWLFGKGLAGRDIPAVTKNIKQIGMSYKYLYKKLLIPLGLINKDQIRIQYRKYVIKYCSEVGVGAYTNLLSATEKSKTGLKYLDFGDLDSKSQIKALKKINNSDKIIKEIIKANKLKRLLKPETMHTIKSNRQVLLSNFNINKYGKRLINIYKTFNLSGSETYETDFLRDKMALRLYLQPENLHLLNIY